jgi:hypothetical protein
MRDLDIHAEVPPWRCASVLRCLIWLEHLDHKFATTWPLFDLDSMKRVLLSYTKNLTETLGAVEDADFEAQRAGKWDKDGIYQTPALISIFNVSGGLEAESGLMP